MSEACTLSVKDRCRQCRDFQIKAEVPLRIASEIGNDLTEKLARSLLATVIEEGYTVVPEGEPGFGQDFVQLMQTAQHFVFATMRSLAEEDAAKENATKGDAIEG